jgi:hypothetical protein
MIRAVEKVRDRMLRAAQALERPNVPYAVARGNAVAAWVSRVDEAAARNTRDVDILCAGPTCRAPGPRWNKPGLSILVFRVWQELAVWKFFLMAQMPALAMRFMLFSLKRK